MPQLPNRELAEHHYASPKTFLFARYYCTMAFVNVLAFIARREDHDPDLNIQYNRFFLSFSAQDVSGLSENDFICAAKAEALA